MKTKKNILAIVFIFLVNCLIFFKIFTAGLYPFPGDLLVSFYFPWYSGGWQGYNPWTTHKELLNADAIRQIYLWKEFAADEFKNGRFPLWNQYTFSGQPLLANFQSSVFYPLNIFFFLTSPQNAWIILIVTQPLLAGIFMFLAARSIKLSKLAALFASTAFMFSSYLITWMENGNIAHGYVWLPLVFYSIQKRFDQAKIRHRYIFLLTVSLSLSIFAGHPQTAIYIYLFAAIFWLYKSLQTKKLPKNISLLALVITASFTLSAIQLVPMYSFYKISPISLPFSREVFDRTILPPQNLITFFASDFFGNPANNNFWSQNYGDHTPYFGVIPFIFSLWAILKLWKIRFVKFATLTAGMFILAAIPGPITYLIKFFEVPILNSTTPSRFISISTFLLIILSAMAFTELLKNINNKKYLKTFFKFLSVISIVYILMWLFAILGTKILEPKDTWKINLSVTRRNLILPTLIFLAIPAIIIGLKLKIAKFLIGRKLVPITFFLSFIIVLSIGGVYYSNKFLPVSPKKFFYPEHPVFYWLNNNAGIDRFYGGGTAHIDFNFPTHYKVYGLEGYDTLRLERYAQLLASSFTGSVPKSYLRSDAVVPNEENGYRKRLFEILGVKYLLDKEDDPKTGSDWHYERFQNDKIKGHWQYGKFQVYSRENTLPRAFLTTSFIVAKNDEEIIKKIYDESFNLKTVILEKEPRLKIPDTKQEIIPQEPIEYVSNKVRFSLNVNSNSLLYFSDAYDNNWKVYIDEKKEELLRANYALRAVAVPGGSHNVEFRYEPSSFYLGAYTTAVSVLMLTAALFIFYKKRML